jgi:hypothetical protein
MNSVDENNSSVRDVKDIKNFSNDIQTTLNQINSLRNILYNTIQSFDDFGKFRQTLDKLLYEYEKTVFMINKKLQDILSYYSSLEFNYDSLTKMKDDLDKINLSQNEQINDLLFQNEISNSQINYYKKQCLEKDNFILKLKKKIFEIEKSSYNNPQDNLIIDYSTYDKIILPERVKRINMNQPENFPTDLNSNTLPRDNININKSNIEESNQIKNKLDYETNFNYGYDYKEDNNNIKNNIIEPNNIISKPSENILRSIPVSNLNKENKDEISSIHQSMNQSINSEIKKSRTTSSNINASNKTLTRRLRDIVLNLCKVDPNAINKLEKKYGNEIINKIQSGQIDEETANNVENDLKHINRRASVIEDKFKQNIQKYLNDKEGLRGWEKLRSYLKVGDKEMKFKKLSAS